MYTQTDACNNNITFWTLLKGSKTEWRPGKLSTPLSVARRREESLATLYSRLVATDSGVVSLPGRHSVLLVPVETESPSRENVFIHHHVSVSFVLCKASIVWY